MRNLILLFLRYGGFISFVLLEVFCLFLIVKYNRTQQEVYVNSSNIFSASLNKRVNNITRYFSLTSTADSLAIENARLYSRLSNQENRESTLKDSVFVDEDTIKQYLFIPAKVINNSINKNNNFLTIAKGSDAGIRPRQGVVSDNGVIGIVRNVSKRYATILSILHRQVRINASIKRTNHFGAIAWRGSDPKLVKLEDIPKHATINIGDTVMTSGYSPRFPRGITLGIVDTFWVNSGSNFFDIEVRLTNDLNNVGYVYVVENEYTEEQIELEEQLENEQ